MIAQKPALALQTAQVEVLRAFYYQGKVQAVKSTATLPRVFALEMAAANKARIVEEPKDETPASHSTAAKSAGEGESRKEKTK